MKLLLVSLVALGVFVLASCAQQGKAGETASGKEMIQLEDYLDLPKSMAGSRDVLKKEGYRVVEVSKTKFVATKRFNPSVIFYTKDGVKMETRKHIVEVFKPEGYRGGGSVKVAKFIP